MANAATAEAPTNKTKRTKTPRKAKPAKTKDKVLSVRMNATDISAMQSDIRMLLLGGTIPRLICSAMVAKYSVTQTLVEKALEAARRDLVRHSGFYKEQIQDICQRTLVDVLNDGRSRPSEKIQAVKQCGELFGLKVEPEDERESEELAYLEAMRRISEMDIPDMDDLRKAFEAGSENPMDLFSPQPMVLKSQKRKASARRRRSQ